MSSTLIERLADRLDSEATDRSTDPGGFLITVTGDLALDRVDGCHITWSNLDGQHPAGALLRLTPPANAVAIGVSGTGWAHTMHEKSDFDGPSIDRGGITQSERIHHLVLVDIEGNLAGRVRWADGRTITSPPASGRIPDLLLRAFGLPTPPPTRPTIELFAAMWLNDVLGVSAGNGRQLSWRRVELLHPAMRVLQEAGSARSSDVETAGRLLGEGWGWEELRRGVAQGRCWGPGITPAEAAHLDAGSFSRLALGWFPPLHELLSEVSVELRPNAARRVRATLRAWGLHRAEGGAAA